MSRPFDGSDRPIDLGGGYSIRLPGLRGRLDTHGARTPGTRSGGPEQALPALDEALAAAAIDEERSIEIDVEHVVAARGETGRRSGAGGAGASGSARVIVLEVPDRGSATGQVVMAADEHGVITWHFPVDDGGVLQPATKRGAGGSKRFEIPAAFVANGAARDAESTKRGLLTMAGKKVLKILAYKAAKALLGVAAERFAAAWEAKHRPAHVRTLDRGNLSQRVDTALEPGEWARLGAGRALLFIHGTFSTTQGGFGRLPGETLDALAAHYGSRVLAYDHPSLSVDPLHNARAFLGLMPPDVTLDVDVICHSRGGLVARSLAVLGGDRLRVGSIVFVAAPNAGTPLASPTRIGDMLNRVSTLLNLVPEGPQSVVTETLDAILAAVKVIGLGALASLDGLAAMDPRGPFLGGALAGAAYDRAFAVAADFEPPASLATLFTAKGAAVNELADRVFAGAANDLVVPTRGVFDADTGPGFPIPDDRVLAFAADRGLAHSDYFAQPETSERLRHWLITGAAPG